MQILDLSSLVCWCKHEVAHPLGIVMAYIACCDYYYSFLIVLDIYDEEKYASWNLVSCVLSS